jgi:hypothetical protein
MPVLMASFESLSSLFSSKKRNNLTPKNVDKFKKNNNLIENDTSTPSTSYRYSSKSTFEGSIDYDEEGRKLQARLGIDHLIEGNIRPSFWNAADPIFKHPISGSMIYVGNQSFAKNLKSIKSKGITHVVNCTYGSSKIPDFHEGHLKYFEFAISHWHQKTQENDTDSMIQFIEPLFDFIEVNDIIR